MKPSVTFSAVFLVCSFSLASSAGAQCDQWQPLGSGTNERVYALTEYDGGLAVGGLFTIAGGQSANRVALWNGSSWTALGSGMNAQVRALTVYNGELIAGGEFTTADAQTVNYIARWDATLSAWQPMGTGMSGGVGPGAFVTALTVYNGELIAGGFFGSAGGVGAYRVARWNGTSWQSTNGGFIDYVFSLTVYNGELIAGGDTFGIPFIKTARWNGTSWQTLGGDVNSNVNALTVYNGELIVGGNFTTANGQPANRIARWNGSSWQALGSGMDESVNALTVYNGELIAGGQFTTAGGQAASRIARWNGASWQTLGSGMTSAGFELVNAVSVYDGKLAAGGGFDAAGGQPANDIAQWEGCAGACCVNGNCAVVSFEICQAFGGVFHGGGSTCEIIKCAPTCPDVAPPGGDGAVNVNDLLAVINAWGNCE